MRRAVIDHAMSQPPPPPPQQMPQQLMLPPQLQPGQMPMGMSAADERRWQRTVATQTPPRLAALAAAQSQSQPQPQLGATQMGATQMSAQSGTHTMVPQPTQPQSQFQAQMAQTQMGQTQMSSVEPLSMTGRTNGSQPAPSMPAAATSMPPGSMPPAPEMSRRDSSYSNRMMSTASGMPQQPMNSAAVPPVQSGLGNNPSYTSGAFGGNAGFNTYADSYSYQPIAAGGDP